MAQSPVWLITGASAGLGLALARYVLTQGHRVVATSRNLSKAGDVVGELEGMGAKWLTLDTGSSDSIIATAMQEAEGMFGQIDIVVNNAAYCVMGSTEDIHAQEVENQMRVNFLGPLSIIRALLPGMRNRRSGVIVNISSIQGVAPAPANGIYAASKAALEAATDSLRVELEPFGIDVWLVLPGGFRTQFANAGVIVESSEPYAASDHPVAKRLGFVKKLGAGAAIGDPNRAAQLMFDMVTGQGDTGKLVREKEMLRVFIGSDSWRLANLKVKDAAKTIDSSREMAATTDFQ
ncbi:hypothetical protein PV10_02229 [Exophiala mesophila]|uniref:Uncharacterized protein n=1 Tax=Exophiala mesophila TaxID=212818 RepID=A0A0D1ZIS5_EXOME|nr:uncharacterized protein PV10_02229 [Exophiala mesophila]KIV94462.1 hypothetical protein PV10_02229 [Exophiala mesophila]